MDFENIDISPELREKAKACTSPEELLALAKSEGYKLSDAEIEAVSGGSGWAGCSSATCYTNKYLRGDSRQGVDPARAHADFVSGAINGASFF
ncbi:MAG: Nif11 family protein [Eggerthellaceae bacterium]|nr:Nif11 family protein [Eggerthellaceae bacterium]MBQ9069709.1 Nif11 family protein [Eggerthellaceae bacterium]